MGKSGLSTDPKALSSPAIRITVRTAGPMRSDSIAGEVGCSADSSAKDTSTASPAALSSPTCTKSSMMFSPSTRQAH